MSEKNSDILVDIADDDLPKLLDMYEDHKDWVPQAYSTILTGIEWKKRSKEKLVTFMSPHDCWRKNGTFFAILSRYTFDIFFFSLEDSGDSIFEGLSKSKRLHPDGYMYKDTYLFAVHYKFYAIALKALKVRGVTWTSELLNNVLCIPREKALAFTIECPPEVYIKKLETSHANLINSLWPHRYPKSEKYISLLIEMNDNYGVFLKSTDELVAWVLLSVMGQLAALQTVDEHKKKGYGSLITKYVSRECAKKGYSPLGTVLVDNQISESMFTKLGSENLGRSTFIYFR